MHTTHKTGPLGLPTPRRTTLGPKKDLEMLRLTQRDQGRKERGWETKGSRMVMIRIFTNIT